VPEPPSRTSGALHQFLIFRISLDGRVETGIFDSHPVPTEGRLAIVTNAGRDAVDADGAFDEWR
jgi:hypothetical protein